MPMEEERLDGGGRNRVYRRGNVVLREAGPWSATVFAFLRHLEAVNFEGSPRIVASGFDNDGREMLEFIDGEFVHPAPWGEAALPAIGNLLRRLHDAGDGFRPDADATWRPWYGRDLGDYRRVFGHGDLGPWNIVAREGHPVALIDWETAGPMDALIELGQACWLNAQLHDDDVAAMNGLPSPEDRARHAALIAEGYGLPRALSRRLVQAMIDVAVADAADQAIEANIAPETTDASSLWGLAWRARSAAWMMRHRHMLVRALN
jgi:Ser/Thr protein kinase RdoA (MazF antagonist)